MIDPAHRPSEIPEDALNSIIDVVNRLRARILTEINLTDPDLDSRFPNLVRGFLQAHLRRCLQFVDGGYAEWVAGRPLVTEGCTRSLYENIAVLCDFIDRLKPLLKSNDYEAAEKHLTQAAFATRVPSFLEEHGDSVKAVQILNQIDRMKKRYEGYRDAYDRLSDIVHPNGLGALVYFAEITVDTIRFLDPCKEPSRALVSLMGAMAWLAFVEVELAELETLLSSSRSQSER